MAEEHQAPANSSEQQRVDQLMRMAFALHEDGKLEHAESTYRRILFMQPNNSEALYLLGEISRQKGRDEDAIRLINKAIACGGHEPAFFFSLACAYHGAGRLKEAVEYYRKIIERDSRGVEARNNLGCVLQTQEDLAGAEREYLAALQIDTEFSPAHYNLGKLLEDRGEVDAAIFHYRRALIRAPDHKDCLNRLGAALTKKGLFAEAAACHDRASALDLEGAERDGA